MKLPARLLAVTVLVGVSGCTETSHADLEAFADETAHNARATADEDSAPPAPSPEPVTYAAGELRNPFQPPSTPGPLSAGRQATVAPDPDRTKGHLERFPLTELRLVGNLSSQRARVALVQDPGGVIHRVGVGDFMGTDFGRVRVVRNGGIELVEIVRDAGGWTERSRFIALGGDQGTE